MPDVQSENITIERQGQRLTLWLSGDIDVCSATKLHKAIIRLLDVDVEGDIMVACEQLQQLDASTLQILIALENELQASDRCLQLQDVPHEIADTLFLAGLGNTFAIANAGVA